MNALPDTNWKIESLYNISFSSNYAKELNIDASGYSKISLVVQQTECDGKIILEDGQHSQWYSDITCQKFPCSMETPFLSFKPLNKINQNMLNSSDIHSIVFDSLSYYEYSIQKF